MESQVSQSLDCADMAAVFCPSTFGFCNIPEKLRVSIRVKLLIVLSFDLDAVCLSTWDSLAHRHEHMLFS